MWSASWRPPLGHPLCFTLIRRCPPTLAYDPPLRRKRWHEPESERHPTCDECAKRGAERIEQCDAWNMHTSCACASALKCLVRERKKDYKGPTKEFARGRPRQQRPLEHPLKIWARKPQGRSFEIPRLITELELITPNWPSSARPARDLRNKPRCQDRSQVKEGGPHSSDDRPPAGADSNDHRSGTLRSLCPLPSPVTQTNSTHL